MSATGGDHGSTRSEKAEAFTAGQPFPRHGTYTIARLWPRRQGRLALVSKYHMDATFSPYRWRNRSSRRTRMRGPGAAGGPTAAGGTSAGSGRVAVYPRGPTGCIANGDNSDQKTPASRHCPLEVGERELHQDGQDNPPVPLLSGVERTARVDWVTLPPLALHPPVGVLVHSIIPRPGALGGWKLCGG